MDRECAERLLKSLQPKTLSLVDAPHPMQESTDLPFVTMTHRIRNVEMCK